MGSATSLFGDINSLKREYKEAWGSIDISN
jgi:hypothetical protein